MVAPVGGMPAGAGEFDGAGGLLLGVAEGVLEVGVVAILFHGQRGEQARANQAAENKGEVEAVAEFPLADVGHDEHEGDGESGKDDGAEDFRFAGEIFQELKEEEEVTLGARGGKLRTGVGGGAEFGPVREQGQDDDGEKDTEAGDGVGEDLVGPEGGVGFFERLFGFDAVAAEEINVPDDERDDEAGQHAGVQREEARERVMAVIRPADDEFLNAGSDEGDDAGDVGGDLGGPIAFFDPTAAGSR